MFIDLGRAGMGMTTLLVLTAMFGSTRGSVPRVSYSSYLDIWMVTCIIFVFASLIEFTLVHSLYRKNNKKQGIWVEKFTQITMPIVFLLFNTCLIHPQYSTLNGNNEPRHTLKMFWMFYHFCPWRTKWGSFSICLF